LDKKLQLHIASLIFTTDHPIKLKEIKSCLEEAFATTLEEAELAAAIDALKAQYASEEHAFELVEIGEGFQFMTKGSYHDTIAVFLKQTTNKRLSRTAMETLSIVAYKQPVEKSELEKIRGVSCDYALQKLLEKELVSIVGRSDAPGRPLLYGTSEKFMDYFGLKSLKDLPQPKDFKVPENAIGEQAPIEEDRPDDP